MAGPAGEAARQAEAAEDPRPSRVIVVHPVVPRYRASFFERVSRRLGDAFCVYASTRDMSGLTDLAHLHSWERRLGPIRSLLPGAQWQPGAVSVPIRRGDIVVVSGVPRCLSNLALLVRARLVGATAIWWGQYWSATSRPWRAALRIALARLSHALIFYTDAEAAAFRESRAGRKRELVFALNNGVETSEVEALRAPYHAAARGRRVLFIGRFTPKSNFELLLRALAHPACTDVRLEVIGGGQNDAGIQALARTLGVDHRIAWHGPTTDEARIARVANDCALFVYPGAVGLSLIHAFAYGLPAIVHDDRLRHYPEIAAFAADRTGMVFRKDDADSLARTIAGALDDPDRLDRMSAEAVETTRRSFNAEDMADRFCSALAAIEAARPRSRRGAPGPTSAGQRGSP